MRLASFAAAVKLRVVCAIHPATFIDVKQRVACAAPATGVTTARVVTVSKNWKGADRTALSDLQNRTLTERPEPDEDRGAECQDRGRH